MSYYQPKDDWRELIRSEISIDPLLVDFLFNRSSDTSDDQNYELMKISLRASIISALSASVFHKGGDEIFQVTYEPPRDVFQKARRALIVGFGGYLEYLIKKTGVNYVHVCDYRYRYKSASMESIVEKYRYRFPDKEITLSSGEDLEQQMQEVDSAFITGSALCNGTMEQILELAIDKEIVVVQGQSASIYPKALFIRGVSLITTTVKPSILMQMGISRENDEKLRVLLEGGLPWIYLTPRVNSIGHQ